MISEQAKEHMIFQNNNRMNEKYTPEDYEHYLLAFLFFGEIRRNFT